MTMIRLEFVAGAALLALASCSSGDARQDTLWQSALAEREVTETRWDTLWVRGGEADSVLFNPYLLTSDGHRLFIYDGGKQRITTFDALNGELLWTFGGEGSGPDEFRGVRDLKVDSRGGVFALDPRNNRIVHLDSYGAVRRRIPLSAIGHAEQIAPLDRDRLALLTLSPDSTFAVLDTLGNVETRFTLPWPGFARLEPLARQGYIAARDGVWAFGFSVGNGWFAFADVEPLGTAGRYVEHTEFPRVRSMKTGDAATKQLSDYNACSGCSLALADSTIYVHFGGYSDVHSRILDRYRLRDGSYLGSMLLPREATVVEVTSDLVFILYEDPFPGVVALKPRFVGARNP